LIAQQLQYTKVLGPAASQIPEYFLSADSSDEEDRIVASVTGADKRQIKNGWPFCDYSNRRSLPARARHARRRRRIRGSVTATDAAIDRRVVVDHPSLPVPVYPDGRCHLPTGHLLEQRLRPTRSNRPADRLADGAWSARHPDRTGQAPSVCSTSHPILDLWHWLDRIAWINR